MDSERRWEGKWAELESRANDTQPAWGWKVASTCGKQMVKKKRQKKNQHKSGGFERLSGLLEGKVEGESKGEREFVFLPV